MTITPDNYLNIFAIIVNEVVGDIFLFILIGIAIIVYICVTNNIQMKPTIALISIFAIMSLTAYSNQFILGLIVLVIGFVIYTLYNYWKERQ